jgi:hypothetical protein
MKAIVVRQPFAFEILSGRKTIEAMQWDTDHRGELLVCSAQKPAFSKEDMEEIEDEYGCAFAYGRGICVVRLLDVRPRRKGDERKALLEAIDPEAFCWVIENPRPVVPFPVKGPEDRLFDVDDSLITTAPFAYGEPVEVQAGAVAKDFGIDFSGWRGRAMDVQVTEEGETRIRVEWDSLALRLLPLDLVERCEREGFDWTGVLLRVSEIQPAPARDTPDDVQDAIEDIIEANPGIFPEYDE